MFDTRPIFRSSYLPAEVQISFADHAEHNAVLASDELTNLAILSIHKATISSEMVEAFDDGVDATIVVVDDAEVELVRAEITALWFHHVAGEPEISDCAPARSR